MGLAACALALVLSIDASASITDQEFKLETQGFADAFVSQEVRQSVIASLPLAITVQQWSTTAQTSIPWVILRTPADVDSFARSVAEMPRAYSAMTQVGIGVQYAVRSFADVPCEPDRKVINVSGDGKDYADGEWSFNKEVKSSLPEVKKEAEDLSITINGLPILNPSEASDQDVVEYYDQVVKTTDGFVIQSRGFDDLAIAIRRKLQQEIM